MSITHLQRNPSSASPWLRRYAAKIANAAHPKPVLDVACGSGRNALFLTQLGCDVIGIDIDVRRTMTNERFRAHRMDVDTEPWPFRAGDLGGIIQVHFLRYTLFARFASSLVAGGYLLIETVPGCGGNYLELPKAGELRERLVVDFDLYAYHERAVGPMGVDAVTVQALARRKDQQATAENTGETILG